MMDALKQVTAVTIMSLRTVPQRIGSSLVVVIGMACAVGALVSILSMSAGFLRTMAATGSPLRVIVLSDGALGEWGSNLAHGEAAVIAGLPGVQKDADGKPIVSAEYIGYTVVPKKSDGLDAYLTVRGVSAANPKLRPEVRLVGGRMFRPGQYEVIVGASAQAQFDGLKQGDKVSMPEGDWLITGTFASNGSGSESELITDSTTLLSAMRTAAYNSMTVRLETADAFAGFKSALTARPGPALEINRESDYYADQSKSFDHFLTTIAFVVGGIMGLGATFGALNTMYSAVSTRSREIATLRAIGFGGGAVVMSVMTEALLFCLMGALLGILFAWAVFNGYQHAMGGLVIRLAVTAKLALVGMTFALLLGAVGGVFPAIRAARLPISDALRAT
jgi:putative ABC transport system permease protein